MLHLHELAKGAYGTIYETNTNLALKLPTFQYFDCHTLLREGILYSLVAKLPLVSVIESATTQEYLGFLTTFLPSTLAQAFEELKSHDHIALLLKFWFRELCRELQVFHSYRIIHNDIKPGNILVDAEYRPFFIDFGLSIKESQHCFKDSRSYTLWYRDPHILKQQRDRKMIAYSFSSDIYALGMSFLELLTSFKFNSAEPAEMLRELETFRKQDWVWPETMHDLRDVVQSCCLENPDERPSLEQLLKIANDWELPDMQGTLSLKPQTKTFKAHPLLKPNTSFISVTQHKYSLDSIRKSLCSNACLDAKVVEESSRLLFDVLRSALGTLNDLECGTLAVCFAIFLFRPSDCISRLFLSRFLNISEYKVENHVKCALSVALRWPYWAQPWLELKT